jgi:hypothetical protein
MEPFSPFLIRQPPGHCGPCSLATALFLLGIETGHREAARAAGQPWHVFRNGLNEQALTKAAGHYGVAVQELLVTRKGEGESFAAALRTHVEQFGPAIVLVQDFGHWLCLGGYLREQEKFAVYDPLDDKAFCRWGAKHLLRGAWNRSDDAEPSQYYALLLRRRDGGKPRWRLTEPWMRIHDRGSDCTAATIARDLEDLVRKAGNGHHETQVPGNEAAPLAQVLTRYRTQVLDAITTWSAGSGTYATKDLRDLYQDYVTCAEACDIRFPAVTDHAGLVAGLTALLSAYWWGGEMGS